MVFPGNKRRVLTFSWMFHTGLVSYFKPGTNLCCPGFELFLFFFLITLERGVIKVAGEFCTQITSHSKSVGCSFRSHFRKQRRQRSAGGHGQRCPAVSQSRQHFSDDLKSRRSGNTPTKRKQVEGELWFPLPLHWNWKHHFYVNGLL